MDFKIKPAKKVVAIIPKQVRKGGVLDYSMDKPQETGEVVAIGSGKCPIDGLKVGDMVAYRRFGESNYYIGGKEYYFIDFKDILALVKGGDK